MKKWLFGFILLTVLSSLGACQRKNGCRGGGWYGDRNLSFVPKANLDVNQDCNVKEEEILTDYEPVMPSR